MMELPQIEELRRHLSPPWRSRFEEILALTDPFCERHLNDEYRQVTRLLAWTMCQDGSPAARGQVRIWAAAIVYVIGWVNFLADPEVTPHMRTDELCRLFGVSESALSRRGVEIRKALDISRFDPNWTLPSTMESNPLVWMIETDEGFILDARALPVEVQEKLVEAGVIPFVSQQGLKLVGGAANA